MRRTYDYLTDLRRDYINAFKATLLSNSGFTSKELHEIAINSGAPQWYCSYEMAMRAVSSLEKGIEDETLFQNPHKRAKYNEIYRRVKKLQSEKQIDRSDAVYAVLNTNAPSFYMSYRTARWILFINRKIKRHEKNQHPIGQYKP